MKYAVQNYTKIDTDTEFGIKWGEESKRISFCAELDGFPALNGEKPGDILRKSIYYNKESIYGAFPTFDESVMSFEGVPKTYVLVESEGLDQWYIPFFVVLGLVLIGVGFGLFMSLRSGGSDDETKPEEPVALSARVSSVHKEPEVELAEVEVKTETNDAFHTEEETTKEEDL